MKRRPSTLVEQTMTELTLVLLFVSFAGVILLSERFERAEQQSTAPGPSNGDRGVIPVRRFEEGAPPSRAPCYGPGARPPGANTQPNTVYLRTNDNLAWLQDVSTPAEQESASCLRELCRTAVTSDLLGAERVLVEFTAYASSAWRGGEAPTALLENSPADATEGAAAETTGAGGAVQGPSCRNPFDCNLALTTDRARNLMAFCEAEVAATPEEQEEFRANTRIVPRGSLDASAGDQQADRRVEIRYVLADPVLTPQDEGRSIEEAGGS